MSCSHPGCQNKTIDFFFVLFYFVLRAVYDTMVAGECRQNVLEIEFNKCTLSKKPKWEHSDSSCALPDVTGGNGFIIAKYNSKATWKIGFSCKVHKFRRTGLAQYASARSRTFIAWLILFWRCTGPTSCIHSVYPWHLTQPLAQAVLPLFKPPIPGRQTGARIRPPPLPPHVHSPCTVSSSNSGL